MTTNDKLEYWRNALIAMILNNVENKIPIKDDEMRDLLDKDKALYRECLPLVVTSLKKVYGIILQKVPESKKFICYSELTACSMAEYDEEQYEEQLFDFLKGLRIDLDEEHPYFGKNLKKLVADTFVKQLYLKRVKSESDTDMETRYLYSWGYRATVEFPAKEVLEQTSAILGKEPREFVAIYNKHFSNENNEEAMVIE